MMRGAVRSIVLAGAFALAAEALPAATPAPAFRVGAAKIDVTPAPAALPASVRGVLDPIYARAILIDNGKSRAALVSVDTIGIPTAAWRKASERVERELHLPPASLVLTATHTHSAFVSEDALVQGVTKAIAEAERRLEPATISYGTGVSYINVNRNMIDPQTRRWTEGANYDGPSDKTLAVVRFSAGDGRPIAVYVNYAVHGVLTGMLDQVSGDIPGAAARYVENALGNGAVAVWSNGAAGDQNPIYFQQTYDLRAIRIRDYARRGQDISNTMLPGGQGLDRNDPAVVRLMDEQKQMALSMGQMLGEEVLHVVRTGTERPEADATIWARQATLTCPGRERTDSGRAGQPGRYKDAASVPIRLSLLRIGDIAIGGVDAELFSLIGQRFKREAPFKHSIMATLANGTAPSGYIANDAAAGYETFEVLSSRVKPGCAESAIVEGLVDLEQDAARDRKLGAF